MFLITTDKDPKAKIPTERSEKSKVAYLCGRKSRSTQCVPDRNRAQNLDTKIRAKKPVLTARNLANDRTKDPDRATKICYLNRFRKTYKYFSKARNNIARIDNTTNQTKDRMLVRDFSENFGTNFFNSRTL